MGALTPGDSPAGPVPHARGRLVLMPNTLDLGTGEAVPLEALLPQAAIERAAGLRHWVAENAKSARAFLKRVDARVPLAVPLQAIAIEELPRSRKGPAAGGPAGSEATPWKRLLAPALAGAPVGLLSEAGMPAVADPGADLVAAAHGLGLDVEPWPGPSALLMALAASGLNGQCFAFHGYLPVEPPARLQRIQALQARSRREHEAQLAIETPYRNAALFDALLAALEPQTRLAIACGLSLPGGWVRSRTVADWRRQPRPDWPDRWPAVFAWQAG